MPTHRVDTAPPTAILPIDQAEGGPSARTSTVLRKTADRLWWALTGLVLLAGVLGQVRVWASDRGFWNDELYVAVNIRSKGFVALATEGLRYAQVAPPGWLMGEHAIYKVLGGNEQVLKFPQLFASATVLVLTTVMAYKCIGRWAALAVAVLLALAPQLYYYAGELKQYSVEAAVAMIIMLVMGAFGVAARGRPLKRRFLIGLSAVMAIVTPASYSALVVVVGSAAGVALLAGIERRWRVAMTTALVAAPAALIGAGQAWLRMQMAFMSDQDSFFPNGFPPEHAGPVEITQWLPRMWEGFIANPMRWGLPQVVLVLAVLGVAALVVRGRAVWAAVFVGVFSAAIGAAIVGGLPLEERVALYLVGPTLILVVAALDGGVRALIALSRQVSGRPLNAAAAIGMAFALAAGLSGLVLAVKPAAAAAYEEVRQPLYRDNARDIMRDVKQRIQPGDVVLVYDFSQPLASWYGEEYGLPIVGLIGPAHVCDTTTVDKALAGAKRVWYIRGARLSYHPDNYHAHVLAELAKRGRLVESQLYAPQTQAAYSSSAWTLIDLTGGPDPNPPTPEPNSDPVYNCAVVLPDWH